MPQSIRKRLIEALSQSEGAFLSGQELANMLECSRTAIWKHIEDLRNSGFEIEAIRKRGYRIISIPDQLSQDEILLGLETTVLGRNVIHFESTESTQLIAHKIANDGAPEGTLVVAEEQTSGRARMTRKWHSSKQKGIWMSLILRPDLPLHRAPQFTMIAAIAIVRAIEDKCGIEANIKWPNDILLNGKKICGILTELHGEADHIHYLITGIGMNINQSIDDFPEYLHEKATSLFIESGKKISRKTLVQQILKNLEKYYKIYLENGFQPLKIIWESYATGIGNDITVRTYNGEIIGKALGITDEGILRVEDHSGKVHHIYSADIELK